LSQPGNLRCRVISVKGPRRGGQEGKPRGESLRKYGPHTALLVVDVQNDFVDPAGSLHVPGGESVVPVLNGEIEKAASEGAVIVYTQDWHPDHTPHFERDGGIWPVHCVRGTWGAAFHPSLRIQGEVVRKGADGKDGYSAFSVRDPRGGERSPTVLDALLREAGVNSLVIGGLATDYCVVETVLDASRLGYQVEVLSDAIQAVNLTPGDGERAIERMQETGGKLI
jgi:nicotinamidase/pyrazinamidase